VSGGWPILVVFCVIGAEASRAEGCAAEFENLRTWGSLENVGTPTFHFSLPRLAEGARRIACSCYTESFERCT
jgi:hypothetical protein